MNARTGALWLLLAAVLLPGGARAACRVESLARITLQVIGGSAVVVPVEVNGIAANFILDTGAQRSLVTEAAVRRLGLDRDSWVGTTIQGIGGIDRRANADPRSLSLGGVKLVRRTLNHDTSLTVGILPHTQIGDVVIDGALGRDFLSLFDLDLDLPDRRLTLYQVQACAGRFLPWSGEYDAVPVTYPAEGAGYPGDTGRRGAAGAAGQRGGGQPACRTGHVSVGLQAASLASDPSDQVSGIGTRPIAMHRHVFRSLRIGADTIDHPGIWVAPIRLTPIVDMLLGADWLAARRVWISYATQQLFVAKP